MRCPAIYGPHETLYNRHVRWNRNGVFASLAEKAGPPERIIIDSTHLKAHRTAASLLQKKGVAAHRTHQRWPELQATRRLRPARRPIILLLSQGQLSDHKGAGLLIDALPPARELIADRGYDSGGFRAALDDLGITPCIPSRRNRERPRPHDQVLYRTNLN